MPGAWEAASPNVLVATLTRELVTTKWAMSYRNLQLPPHSATSVLTGMPFDHARNTACENMLNNGFSWLFFLDDDVATPPDIIHRLLSHQKDIVSAVYNRRALPICPVALRYDAQGQAQWVTGWPQGSTLIDVDLVGAGALLIHRRVLERMQKPWFEWELGRVDPPGAQNVPAKLSEDFAFCRKAKRNYGFQIFLDTTIQCEHIGLGESKMAVGSTFTPSSVG